MNPSKNTIKRMFRAGPPPNGEEFSPQWQKRCDWVDVCIDIWDMSTNKIDPLMGTGASKYAIKTAKKRRRENWKRFGTLHKLSKIKNEDIFF